MKPCPFCGGAGIILQDEEQSIAVVECPQCGARGPGITDQWWLGEAAVRARELWNERRTDDREPVGQAEERRSDR